jgi:hypothetical protein
MEYSRGNILGLADGGVDGRLRIQSMTARSAHE